MPHLKHLFLALSFFLSGLSLAGELSLETSNGVEEWNSSNAIWNPGTLPLVSWSDNSEAVFQNGLTTQLLITENLQVESIIQRSTGTEVTLSSQLSNTLSLTGSDEVVSNSSGAILFFDDSTSIVFAPATEASEQIWYADQDSDIVVDGSLSGVIGTIDSGVATGGFIKTGAGKLQLNGSNAYLGVTGLREGVIEANHANAFGSSEIRFEGGALDGGVLRYGANSPDNGYSNQFGAIAKDKVARFDTNGRSNIIFTHGLTGQGGIEKMGAGTLTLGTDNTYQGATRVKAGVLKAAAGYTTTVSSSTRYNFIENPFGTGTQIIVENGATLDVNGNGVAGGTSNFGNTKTYEITADGLGLTGLATIWNSGILLSNTSLISKLTFNSDISFGGTNRIDLALGTQIHGGTNTFYKRGNVEVAWISNYAGNSVGNIVVEAGTFTIQSNQLGSLSHHIIAKNSTFVKVWASRDVSKGFILEGGSTLQSNGSSPTETSNSETTVRYNGNIDFAGGTIKLDGNTGYRNNYYNGTLGGDGNVQFTGVKSDSKLTPGSSQVTTHIVTNQENDFSGNILIKDSVVRLSHDGMASTAGGTLGEATNQLTLETASNDGRAVLDLHGKDLSIGLLISAGAGTARIQNRRAGTLATLEVGNGGGNATFQGIIEDYSTVFLGKALSTDGSTGSLAIEKVGSGRQTFTNINTFTGGLSIQEGELQVGIGTAKTSTARVGHSSFTISGSGILSGNGTAGMSGQSSTNEVGGKVRVGTSDQTSAQQLQVAGSFTNLGSIEVDIFSATLGGGNNDQSDSILFSNNERIELSGTLSVTDKSASSLTWTEGTWFRVVDWSNVTTSSNRVIGFSDWYLPALSGGLVWDMSDLGNTGRIIVAVPEPTRGLITFLWMVALLFRRARK